MKTIRDHDKLYLSEDRKHQPKEYFKFIYNIAKKHLDLYSSPRILDIGCATGDFLFYLESVVPHGKFTGTDVMPELLDRAKVEVPSGKFLHSNICEKKELPQGRFDAIFMLGVHSIFDGVSFWLENTLSLAESNPPGRIYIFGIFNPEDVDILLRSKPSNAGELVEWQTGWNCISRKTVSTSLVEKGIKNFVFHDFHIGIDIPKNKKDSLRSWTFKYEDGTRGIVNGLQLLHNFALLEIALK